MGQPGAPFVRALGGRVGHRHQGFPPTPPVRELHIYDLSSPQPPTIPPNPLIPIQIKLLKTWHSYPPPITTIELGIHPDEAEGPDPEWNGSKGVLAI